MHPRSRLSGLDHPPLGRAGGFARPAARRRRGATLTEYAFLLVGVLLVGAGAVKLLGSTMGNRLGGAGSTVNAGGGGAGGGGAGGGGSGGSGSSGGGSGSSGGGGGGGGRGSGGGEVAGKSNASSKTSLGGGASSDGLSGSSGGGGGQGAGASNSGATPDTSDEKGVAASLADGDLEAPKIKRLMAMSFLLAGGLALGFYAYKAKKALKKSDAG